MNGLSKTAAIASTDDGAGRKVRLVPESEALTLAPTARSCTEGRRFVVQTLTSWGLTDLLDAAELLASEVIANAVLHARTTLTVTVTQTAPGTVRIDVSDGSTRIPEPRRPDAEATNGRGLVLLDALAASWTVRTTETGKTVSFLLDASSDPWAAFDADLQAVEL